jgi:hypothetical protein
MSRTATCVWRVDPALVLALDERLGPPVDSYLNGSQTWLADVGPGEVALEFRLHPVAGYRLPDGMSHYDLWEQVVAALSGAGDDGGANADALLLGTETRALSSLWEGLECFAAYGDDLEPAPLAAAAGEAVGRAPDAAGLVDHARIGSEWERAQGAASIVDMLLAELNS